MKIHELRTWSEYYWKIVKGEKKWEYRINDRNFKPGDILFLREYSPETGNYTGEGIIVMIERIWNGLPGMPADYCILDITMSVNGKN